MAAFAARRSPTPRPVGLIRAGLRLCRPGAADQAVISGSAYQEVCTRAPTQNSAARRATTRHLEGDHPVVPAACVDLGHTAADLNPVAVRVASNRARATASDPDLLEAIDLGGDEHEQGIFWLGVEPEDWQQVTSRSLPLPLLARS